MKKTYKALLCGAAAVAAVGIAFLLEYLDRSVKSEEQVSEILGVPVLGVIPRVGKE